MLATNFFKEIHVFLPLSIYAFIRRNDLVFIAIPSSTMSLMERNVMKSAAFVAHQRIILNSELLNVSITTRGIIGQKGVDEIRK